MKASGGGVLRDAEGKLVFAFFKHLGDLSILKTEALASLHGLKLCRDKGINGIQVEVDSALLVQYVHAGLLGPWLLCIRLGHIRMLLQQMHGYLSRTFK